MPALSSAFPTMPTQSKSDAHEAALCSPESIKLTCTTDGVIDRRPSKTLARNLLRDIHQLPGSRHARQRHPSQSETRQAPGQISEHTGREFVREEIHHIREGKHGATSTRQAITIGLSKARRAGVELPPPKKGEVSEKTRKNAARAYERGHGAPPARKPTAKRKRATLRALRREPRAAASHTALARQAHSAAARRTRAKRAGT